MLLLLPSMFEIVGHIRLEVRLLGKVKRNWMPVLVSPSCKRSPKIQAGGVRLRGWPLQEGSGMMLPQMVPIYLTCGSRTDYRCWALTWTSESDPPGEEASACVSTWLPRRGLWSDVNSPGEWSTVPWGGALWPGPASCQGWPVFAAIDGSSSQVEELGSQSLSRVRRGGWAWVELIILIHL